MIHLILIIHLPALLTLYARHGSSYNEICLVRLLLGLGQWHAECLSLEAAHRQILGENIWELFKYWLNVSWNLQLNLWFSFSRHKCVTSQTFVQALLELIRTSQVHHHLSFSLINLFPGAGCLDWFDNNFTLQPLWMNEQWLIHSYIVKLGQIIMIIPKWYDQHS